ncbi:helix-turn-helix transcriptional regulator [Methylocapsa sp. S129]|uniref:helix-turn-helix transcriptional regulator n=1 Tax=Methylocapsa sp. S129 TaxID=1641869 RepID=UPI001FEF0F65|nr:helix-turn-helix transcriptional regulator [Methylocapsa sp. S129]
MREIENFSDLIGDIYDTTLDRLLWPDVLKKIARFIDGMAAAVFWSDAANSNAALIFHDGASDPHYRDLYFTKYVKLNPTTTARFFAEVEEPVATSDLLPYDEFLRTRFYREWVRPQGLVDDISVNLEKATTSAAMFSAFRHERHGLVDDEMRRRARLLAPHIRRAVLIAKAVDLKQVEAATFAQALDGLRAGMIFVDAGGRIMHANRAGHILLAGGDVLRAAGGRLISGEARIDANLSEIFAAAAEGDAAVGAKGVALPLTAKTGERYVAHVLPLTSGARERAGSSLAATAAVFVHKAALEAASPPVAIAEAYKLTMTELRVLFAIVEVGGAPEVAEMLGIAASTVKTHLGRIFEKTGAARQADLVKLVAGFSSPLVN